MKSRQFLLKLKKPKLLLVRRIVGKSMQPGYLQDRIVWASGIFHKLHPGDVVIIDHAGLEKMKRIEAIQDGELFVLGDNAAQSTDSRSFGWLSTDDVRAKVLWPRR